MRSARWRALSLLRTLAVGPTGMSMTTWVEPAAIFLDKSEEHTSELQSLMRISYAVFCLKKKKIKTDYAQSRIHKTTYKTSRKQNKITTTKSKSRYEKKHNIHH